MRCGRRLYREEKLGHRDRHIQQGGGVKRPRETTPSASREQIRPHSPQMEPPCGHLELGLAASRTARQHVFVVSATQLVVLCYGSPRKLIRPSSSKAATFPSPPPPSFLQIFSNRVRDGTAVLNKFVF